MDPAYAAFLDQPGMAQDSANVNRSVAFTAIAARHSGAGDGFQYRPPAGGTGAWVTSCHGTAFHLNVAADIDGPAMWMVHDAAAA